MQTTDVRPFTYKGKGNKAQTLKWMDAVFYPVMHASYYLITEMKVLKHANEVSFSMCNGILMEENIPWEVAVRICVALSFDQLLISVSLLA